MPSQSPENGSHGVPPWSPRRATQRTISPPHCTPCVAHPPATAGRRGYVRFVNRARPTGFWRVCIMRGCYRPSWGTKRSSKKQLKRDMNSSFTFLVSAIGFAALFTAIWLMHRPLDVHASPVRCANGDVHVYQTTSGNPFPEGEPLLLSDGVQEVRGAGSQGRQAFRRRLSASILQFTQKRP